MTVNYTEVIRCVQASIAMHIREEKNGSNIETIIQKAHIFQSNREILRYDMQESGHKAWCLALVDLRFVIIVVPHTRGSLRLSLLSSVITTLTATAAIPHKPGYLRQLPLCLPDAAVSRDR
jgi:hypothetical protein